MNAHPHDHEGQPGTVYVVHVEPAYHHARHYIGLAVDVDARLAEHLAGAGSPLVRAAVAVGVRVELAATIPSGRMGSQSEALAWFSDEWVVSEGDLVGLTRDQVRALAHRRDRQWLRDDRRRPADQQPFFGA
jgi:hypothetical protein